MLAETRSPMPYMPRRRDWDLDSLMTPVLGRDVRPTGESATSNGASIESRLWTDLVAEYDARLLEAELGRRAAHRTAPFSSEFGLFLDAWALDEEKHAEGLARLYCLVMDVERAELDARLAERQGDFSSFEAILDDEFKLAVLFAYDEAMSTRGYSEDIPFYASLGPPAFETLLRHLKNDEAVHYANAVELLAHRFADRAGDVPAAMAEIVELDQAQESYQGTFILDHATAQFSSEQMHKVGDSVGAAIVRRLS